MSYLRRLMLSTVPPTTTFPVYDCREMKLTIKISEDNIDKQFVMPFDISPDILELWTTSGLTLSIYWGDGTVSIINGNGYDIDTLTHIYESFGTYIITVFCEGMKIPNLNCWKYKDTPTPSSIISIDSPFIEFIKPIFDRSAYAPDEDEDNFSGGVMRALYGCKNITSIPPFLLYRNTKINNADYLFCDCVGLTEIPKDIFIHTPNITSFGWTFAGCLNIEEISEDIFIHTPTATSFIGTFNTSGIHTTTDKLFSHTPNADNFSNCFSFSKLQNIHPNMFSMVKNATNFTACFYNCLDLINVPVEIFQENINATTFDSTFAYCENMTTIPEFIFATNMKVTDFNKTFFSCDKLQLNPNIFCDETTEKDTRFAQVNTVDFTECFRILTKQNDIGTAPELWDYNIENVIPTDCFKGQGYETIINYGQIPEDWK